MGGVSDEPKIDNEQTVSELTDGITEFQDNEQTVSELTDGITEFQGLHTSQLVVLLLFQRNFASLFGDLFQPNAASLSWLKEEVRYYTEENNDPLEDCLADFTRENPAEAAKLNREITSIFEVHSIIQKYWVIQNAYESMLYKLTGEYEY
ncbi:unnamed protein product [Heterobilharzia americana]|nr:unnamed protein product [Heterobilharzia americana]